MHVYLKAVFDSLKKRYTCKFKIFELSSAIKMELTAQADYATDFLQPIKFAGKKYLFERGAFCASQNRPLYSLNINNPWRHLMFSLDT